MRFPNVNPASAIAVATMTLAPLLLKTRSLSSGDWVSKVLHQSSSSCPAQDRHLESSRVHSNYWSSASPATDRLVLSRIDNVRSILGLRIQNQDHPMFVWDQAAASSASCSMTDPTTVYTTEGRAPRFLKNWASGWSYAAADQNHQVNEIHCLACWLSPIMSTLG